MKKLFSALALLICAATASLRGQTFTNATLNGTLTINASSIGGSAIIPPAMLGTGVASSVTILYGDGVWRANSQQIPTISAGTSGLSLSNTGTSLIWANLATVAAGANETIQYNNNGAFGGASGLFWVGADLLNIQTINGNSTPLLGIQNLSTGSGAGAAIAATNLFNNLYMTITGTGYSGSLITGSPTGQGGFVYTTGAIPLTLGTNGGANLIIASGGNMSIDAAAPAINSTLIVAGSQSGANANGLTTNPSLVFSGNSQSMYGIVSESNISLGGFSSSLSYANIAAATPTVGGSGTLGTSYQLYIAQGVAATASYGIYQAGTDKNFLNGNTGIGGPPNAGYGLYENSALTGSSIGLESDPTFTFTVNAQNSSGVRITTTYNTGSGLTTLTGSGVTINTPSLTGSSGLANAYQLYIAQGASATASYGIFQQGSNPNVLTGNLTVGTAGGTASTITAPGSTGGQQIAFVGQNSSTATNAYEEMYLTDVTNSTSLIATLTGSGYTGTYLTGGPSGQAGVITTNGAIPLLLGTNLHIAAKFDSSQNATFYGSITAGGFTWAGNQIANVQSAFNSFQTGIFFQNSNTGASAAGAIAVENNSHILYSSITGTGFTGNGITGAPSGEVGLLYTTGSVPLVLGVNSIAAVTFGAATNPTTQFAGPVYDTMTTLTYASPTTVTVSSGNVFKVTTVNATGSVTFNAASGGTAGQHLWIYIVNDATSGKTITWGSNFDPQASTLVGIASKGSMTEWLSDGTSFREVSRITGLL
jgi:hypothetical protein